MTTTECLSDAARSTGTDAINRARPSATSSSFARSREAVPCRLANRLPAESVVRPPWGRRALASVWLALGPRRRARRAQYRSLVWDFGGADRIRTEDRGFADLCLTTWLRRRQDDLTPRPAHGLFIERMSGKRDSNPRLRPWQGRTLPLSYSRSRRTLTVPQRFPARQDTGPFHRYRVAIFLRNSAASSGLVGFR